MLSMFNPPPEYWTAEVKIGPSQSNSKPGTHTKITFGMPSLFQLQKAALCQDWQGNFHYDRKHNDRASRNVQEPG